MFHAPPYRGTQTDSYLWGPSINIMSILWVFCVMYPDSETLGNLLGSEYSVDSEPLLSQSGSYVGKLLFWFGPSTPCFQVPGPPGLHFPEPSEVHKESGSGNPFQVWADVPNNVLFIRCVDCPEKVSHAAAGWSPLYDHGKVVRKP